MPQRNALPTIRLTYGRALVLLVLLAGVLRFANIPTVKMRTPDERVYTSRSDLWLRDGAQGMRREVREFETSQQYPPPTRIGLFEYISWAMWLTGRHDVVAGAVASAAASTCAVVFLALLCYRFLSPVPSLIAMLLYAVAPLDLDVARRAWVEGPTEAITLAMMYLTCRILEDPAGERAAVWAVLLALAGSVGFTIKESMPLPFVLCAIPALWTLVRGRQTRTVAIFIGAGVLSGALALGWLSWAVGSLSELVGILAGHPAYMAANSYTQACCVGAPYLLPHAFWLLTPWVSLAFLAGVWRLFVAGGPPVRELLSMRWIGFIGGGQVVFIMLSFMDLRYMAPALGPVYLIAGYGIAGVCRMAIPRAETARWNAAWGNAKLRGIAASVAAAAVLAVAMSDYARFQRIFVRDDLQDPGVNTVIEYARRR